MKTEILDLKTRWTELLQKVPKLRIRDAARELGVSEAELLATRCGESVTRLEGNWGGLIKKFPALGEVMCLTRNEAAVHERYGTFTEQISFFHEMGQVVGPDIDLRLFMNHWEFGFAVTDDTDEGPRRSLHFFDADGTAVFKVYLTKQSNVAIYDEFVQKYRAANQSAAQIVLPRAKVTSEERPDSDIDVEGFRKAWGETKDTHEFFGLLKKFGVARQQALRLAPPGQAWRVELSATQKMLEAAASRKVPIMVFVGSPGCIQIHTGPVENIKRFGETWLNVLDDRFNFHLNETLATSAWVVKKATKDGHVTSLELFDAAGENLVLFFGKRKPGENEDPAWRAIVAELSVAT
jgi:putative hemin transport protein